MNINPFRSACKYHREFEYPRTMERVKLFSAVTKLLFCSWRGVKRLMSIRCKCPKGRKLMPTLAFISTLLGLRLGSNEVVKCTTYVNDWAFRTKRCVLPWEKRTLLCLCTENRIGLKNVCFINIAFVNFSIMSFLLHLKFRNLFPLKVESNFSKSCHRATLKNVTTFGFLNKIWIFTFWFLNKFLIWYQCLGIYQSLVVFLCGLVKRFGIFINLLANSVLSFL